MYTIFWQYKIKSAYKEKFETEYGPNGTWSKLFSSSQNYNGSSLHKSEKDPDTYILIDTWRDKESYETFINTNKEEYNKLSLQFERFYETEEKLGTFYYVK